MVATASASAPTSARRGAILEATLRVIGQGGVDAVTHRRVAQEARVALGSIAYHFGSREALLPAAFRFYMEGVARDADRMIAGGVPGDRDLAIANIVELSERDLDQPALVQAEYEMLVYAARDPELAREVEAWQRELDRRLAETLEEIGVPRPLEAARHVRGALRGFELERLVRPSAKGDELRQRLEVVLDGLLASTPHTP